MSRVLRGGAVLVGALVLLTAGCTDHSPSPSCAPSCGRIFAYSATCDNPDRPHGDFEPFAAQYVRTPDQVIVDTPFLVKVAQESLSVMRACPTVATRCAADVDLEGRAIVLRPEFIVATNDECFEEDNSVDFRWQYCLVPGLKYPGRWRIEAQPWPAYKPPGWQSFVLITVEKPEPAW